MLHTGSPQGKKGYVNIPWNVHIPTCASVDLTTAAPLEQDLHVHDSAAAANLLTPPPPDQDLKQEALVQTYGRVELMKTEEGTNALATHGQFLILSILLGGWGGGRRRIKECRRIKKGSCVALELFSWHVSTLFTRG